MIKSLFDHDSNIKLWVLCLDEYTYSYLKNLKLKNLNVILMSDFEDKSLLKAKKNRSLVEYYWTCTPSLPLYLFKIYPKINQLIYLDADLYFYSSIIPAIKEFAHNSIFTVEHRYPKDQESRNETSGRFNVAFQIFKRDKEGLDCLKRWRYQCLNWCYWKNESGKMGDQAYLNEWPNLYSNLTITQNLGIDAAPWNINQYQVTRRHNQVYINEYPLICYHFHQFKIINEKRFLYASGYYFSNQIKKLIYLPYRKELQNQIKIIKNYDSNYSIDVKYTYINQIKHLILANVLPIYWKLQTISK
jgi:hypothetical protein